MRPDGTVAVRRLGVHGILTQHDRPSVVHVVHLEPALRTAKPHCDDVHRSSLLRSSPATINDAATWSPSAGGINLTLKGHAGMVPIRGRNLGQLGAAVRFAYNRVAEIEAFKSALDASLRMHGPMLIEVTHDRSG